MSASTFTSAERKAAVNALQAVSSGLSCRHEHPPSLCDSETPAVDELEKKALAEAGPGETVVREKGRTWTTSTFGEIRMCRSRTRKAITRKVFEAERRPNTQLRTRRRTTKTKG